MFTIHTLDPDLGKSDTRTCVPVVAVDLQNNTAHGRLSHIHTGYQARQAYVSAMCKANEVQHAAFDGAVLFRVQLPALVFKLLFSRFPLKSWNTNWKTDS